MDMVADVLRKSTKVEQKYKPVIVKKHLDVEYDIGTLLTKDINDFDNDLLGKNRDDYFLNLTRDNTQLLLNQIWELPTERVQEVIVVKLPQPKIVLPRMKSVLKPRLSTKWQQFANAKGIRKRKKRKLEWDDQLKKWISSYGFKRAKADREKSWLIEVPDNENPLKDQFAKRVQAKSERIARNELQRLRNIARARNVKIPKMGTLNPDISLKNELQTNVTTGLGVSRKRKWPSGSEQVESTEDRAFVKCIVAKRRKRS